jgi:hypothetical protein
MGRRTRECRVCGSRYEYCPTCSQDKFKPTWMVEFHEENCRTIWDTCTRFNMELISKEEAQAIILECDLSKQENFAEFIKDDIAKILAEDPKPEPVVVEEPRISFKKHKPVFEPEHEVVTIE